MMQRESPLLIVVVTGVVESGLSASELFILSDPIGLSAEVEFTLLDPCTLEIRAQNTSTCIPDGFEAADHILTGVSWDFGHLGYNGDPEIIGGWVIIGPDSETVNFDTGWYGPDFDVSGEYGYGNMDGTGALTNFVSAHASRATPFGGANLDGAVSIDGPQGGVVADPNTGGLGAIQDEIIATLLLNEPLADLECLYENLVRVEFGSDAYFITTPEPTTLSLLALCGLALLHRRRN
jgi:hypothetical protein